MTGFLLALALGCQAWGQAPAASTETVAASTAATVGIATWTAPAPMPEAPAPMPEAAPVRRSRVTVHKDAADWEPFSVARRSGSAVQRTSFQRQVRKIRGGGYRGRPSSAKAAARSYPAKDDRWLVISVYPASLRAKRMHLEARFLIQEGYIEEVKIAAVSVVGGTYSPNDDKEDSLTLRAKGVDFIEEAPGSAEVEIAVMDPAAGRGAANEGRVRYAAFGDKDLGFVDFAWALTGVSGVKPPQPGKPSRKPQAKGAKPKRGKPQAAGPKPAWEAPSDDEDEPVEARPPEQGSVSGVQIQPRPAQQEPSTQEPAEEPSEEESASDEPAKVEASSKKPAKDEPQQEGSDESEEEGQSQAKESE